MSRPALVPLGTAAAIGVGLLMAACGAPGTSNGGSADAAAASGVAVVAVAGAGSPLAGSWEAQEYRLASGVTHAVRGRIFFSEADWTVLFFVVDAEGVARRGSGEGGTYRLDGNDLVFTHLYHLSEGSAMEGLPAAELRMTARAGEGPTEPSTIALEGDRLEIRFPSGNAMTFRRRP